MNKYRLVSHTTPSNTSPRTRTQSDYDALALFFDRVCNEYHKNPGGTKRHRSAWALPLDGVPADGKLDLRALGLAQPLSMRVRVGRNLTSFPLPGAMTKGDRIRFEKTMLDAFSSLRANPAYGGSVFSLTPHADWLMATGESRNPNLISAARYQVRARPFLPPTICSDFCTSLTVQHLPMLL
jgi:hypothetical protein